MIDFDKEVERSLRFLNHSINYRFSVWQQTVWFLDAFPEKRATYVNPRLDHSLWMYVDRDSFEKAIGYTP